MHSTSAAGSSGRRVLAGLGALAVALSAGIAIAAPAHAAATEVDDVTLRWAMSEEAGGGAYFGGCNFLVAGAAGNAGGSRVWTEADGFYQTEVGNVAIEKPTADGGWAQPTWATKCQNASGAAVGTGAGSTTGNQVVLSAGTGTVDTEGGTAEISWDGDYTVVFYGGMTYWTVSDPTLTVAADGTGTLTGTGSGWGASMEDPTLWEPLTPAVVELATFTGLSVDADGFTATPEYLGVEVDPGEGVTPQVRTGAHWGSFPQSYVTFQHATGQSSYWYSSGGGADPKKPAAPVSVAWTVDGGGEPGEPGDGDVPIEVVVPEPVEPEPGVFSWTIQGSGAVDLGTATASANGFSANGNLHSIAIEDTREGGQQFSISGVAGAFSSGSNTFAGGALGWTPSLTGELAGVQPGAAVAAGSPGLGSTQTLVAASAGHALGTVTVDAQLELLAPANTPAGAYTSTLTLTALG
jgi:hypothetical protein